MSTSKLVAAKPSKFTPTGAPQLDDDVRVEFGSRRFAVTHLTPFGFRVEDDFDSVISAAVTDSNAEDEVDGDHELHASLLLGKQSPMDVAVCVRHSVEGFADCSFLNLSLDQQDRLLEFLNESARRDESPSDQAPAVAAEPVSQKRRLPWLAGLPLATTAAIVLGGAWLLSFTSLEIPDAALVGNYLPIHARLAGEVAEVLIEEGAAVSEGDALLRLHNPAIELALSQIQADLAAAEAAASALKKRISDVRSQMETKAGEVARRQDRAAVELRQIEQRITAERAEVERLAPYLESGAVTQREIDEARIKLTAWEAERTAKQNQINDLPRVQQAANSNGSDVGNGGSDELVRLTSELAVAEATQRELGKVASLASETAALLTIVAPRDGEVLAIRRHKGDFVQMADEAVALSFDGEAAALGFVRANEARKIKPGQEVQISLPAVDASATGRVAAVGRGAVSDDSNARGAMRGMTAADVPIKVELADVPNGDLPRNLPPGARIEMTVAVGTGVEWLDSLLGYAPVDEAR